MSRLYFKALFDEDFCDNCAFGGNPNHKENHCHHVEYQNGRDKKIPCSATTCPLLRDLIFKAFWPWTKKPG